MMEILLLKIVMWSNVAILAGVSIAQCVNWDVITYKTSYRLNTK